MTLDARAEKIARECVIPHAVPLYVATTQYQTEKVIAAAKAQILIELKSMLADYHIKLE